MRDINIHDYIDINDIAIAIDEFNLKDEIDDIKFQLETSIEFGNNKFEEDEWNIMQKPHRTHHKFDYRKIDELIDNRVVNIDFKNIVKCFIGNSLLESSVHFSQKKLTHIIEFMEISELFTINTDEIDKIKDYYLEKKVSEAWLQEQLNNILDLIDYCGLKELRKYEDVIYEIIGQEKASSKARVIPSGRDIFLFDKYVKRFFKEVDNESLKIYYMPILIWWKITNIIPMRPIEFCTIKRNCIMKKENKFYIKLPREKQSAGFNKQRLPIEDTIEINKETYNMIEQYINKTNQFGKTNTLLSYRSYEANSPNMITNEKEEKDFYSYTVLYNLLSNFNNEIIQKLYGEADITQNIRLNDTRHFSIISLMLQGVSSVAIAQLAGQRQLKSQDNYKENVQQYMDSEIYRLLDEKGIQDEYIPAHLKLEEILNNMPKKCPVDNPRSMKIGYCTDDSLDCENLKYCCFCSKWWCDKNDLKSFKKLAKMLREELIDYNKKLLEKDISFMLKLFKQSGVQIFDGNVVTTLDEKILIKQKANSISSLLNQVATGIGAISILHDNNLI